jgi:hypothetical protein
LATLPRMRRAAILLTLSVAVAALFAVPGLAQAPKRPPYVVLATVGMGSDRWQLVVFREARPHTKRPCFAVGMKLKHRSPYFYAGTGTPCRLPEFGGATDARGDVDKQVLGLAFPPNVARVHLDLGPVGERDLTLKLLTEDQAREAGVQRFSWGYLKLRGESCLHEATGFDATGNVVFQATEDPAAPCSLEPSPPLGSTRHGH